jgi:hypothetical protein
MFEGDENISFGDTTTYKKDQNATTDKLNGSKQTFDPDEHWNV